MLWLSGTGSAAQFEGAFSLSGDAFSDPGLVVEVFPQSGTFGFELDEGESVTFGLFDIWTNETTVNGDDTAPQSINALFDFDIPDTMGTLNGSATGNTYFWGLIQNGQVEWNNPLLLTYGTGDSGLLSVSLSEEFFNWGLFGLSPGWRYGANVQATFTNVADQTIASAPLPAALPLLLSALAAAAVFVRMRRRRKADTAEAVAA